MVVSGGVFRMEWNGVWMNAVWRNGGRARDGVANSAVSERLCRNDSRRSLWVSWKEQ